MAICRLQFSPDGFPECMHKACLVYLNNRNEILDTMEEEGQMCTTQSANMVEAHQHCLRQLCDQSCSLASAVYVVSPRQPECRLPGRMSPPAQTGEEREKEM